MAADAKIAALYGLPTKSSQPLCDEASCSFFVNILSKFHDFVSRDLSNHPWITEAELDSFGQAIELIQKKDPLETIKWYPEYGCSLLMESGVGCTPGEVAWNLISLDLHRFDTVTKLNDANKYEYIDTAHATDYEVFHIGTSPQKQVVEIIETFQSLLVKAQSTAGSHRNSLGGKKLGHQKTPASIHALFLQAFGATNQCPRGGFTDVGQHTGSKERDTAWPLVCAALDQVIFNESSSDINEYFLRKVIAYFGLFITKVTIDQYVNGKSSFTKNSNAPHELLDFGFRILQSTTRNATLLSDDGLGMDYFIKWTMKLKKAIIDYCDDGSRLYSVQFKLPSTIEGIVGSTNGFKIELSTRDINMDNVALKPSRIHELEIKNLGSIKLPLDESLNGLSNWEKLQYFKASGLRSIYFLRSTEKMFWSFSDDFSKSFKVDQLETLSDFVDSYRLILDDFIIKSERRGDLSIIELRSREVLVVWIAFCVIHSNTVQLHKSEMEDFGVALNYEHLGHLVLSDPHEWEIFRQISNYLSGCGISRPVFSLREEIHTFNMGRRVADNSEELQDIWRLEQDDAERRVDKHWEKVKKKKARAEQLRSEISDLRSQLSHTESNLSRKRTELADHKRKLDMRNSRYASRWDIDKYDQIEHSSCEQEVSNLTHKLQNLRQSISLKKHDLKMTIKAPDAVFQPLPKNKGMAMSIIFFLYMPREYQLLSRFSFVATQLLLPKNWSSCWGGELGQEKVDISQVVTRPKSCQYSWTDYYNKKAESVYLQYPSRKRSGLDDYLLLRAVEENIPDSVGSKCVDQMYDRENGVWYPDSLKPRMAWFGGPLSIDQFNGVEIDPFANVNHFCIVSHFTERLKEDESDLQWALFQPGDDYINRIRGNLPYAKQHSKPSWLSKNQFLTFARMRSYPLEQIRKILISIANNELPFEERAVQILISQALFHVGDITINGGKSKLEWKRDLYQRYGGRSAHCVLESFCKEIADSPKRYRCVKLLGKLCNFFYRWEPKCRATARSLAWSVSTWASEIDEVIEKTSTDDIPSMRATQVVYYQQSILVLLNGRMDQSDVEQVIRMIVLSRNLFTDSMRLDEISSNGIEIKYFVSQRLEDMLEILNSDRSIMTKALRSVLQRCPAKLQWKVWHQIEWNRTPCFTATGDDGNTYSMNVITGDVLINGIPPSRLPISIIKHPLYRRTFGSRNHEVVNKGDGSLETVREACGRFYRFLFYESQLSIFEFKVDGSEELELLDSTPEGIISWGNELPTRLKEMHSHWLYREQQAIVLRGILFDERDISFIVRLDGDHSVGPISCIEQHSNVRKELKSALSENNVDIMVRQESTALMVLTKFERKEHIYSLQRSVLCETSSRVKFYLPRYQLTFTLETFDDDRYVLHCREISGYILSTHQQLDSTLKGASCYLVLEKLRGNDRLLIIPKGEVVRTSSSDVSIKLPDECEAELNFFKYNFHPRFDYLETNQGCLARMQLTALHVATSHAIPDELLQMTGEERAVELIRQTWRNSPLSEDEYKAVKNIEELSRGKFPTMSLLCKNVEIGASQFHFLHPKLNCFSSERIHLSFEGTSYLNNIKLRKTSSRSYLNKREEIRLLGSHSHRPSFPPRFNPDQLHGAPPVESDDVKLINMKLVDLRINIERGGKKGTRRIQPFPLNNDSHSQLENDMIGELKSSWDAHNEVHQTKFVGYWTKILLTYFVVYLIKLFLFESKLNNIL